MARILVVEDSPTQAQQLTILLGEAGFDISVAADAAEAYALATRVAFDLIMVDIYLPDEDGFELCRRLKANTRLTHTPVLLDTADSNPKNVLRGLAAGADAFMTKDHSPAEIVNRVQRTLSGGARQVNLAGIPYTQVSFQQTEFLLQPTVAQLLNVLLSAFEDVLNLNDRLKSNETALRRLNGEIRSANRALEHANRLKDRFLSMAAHDLRNPIANISVMASMMLQDQCSPDERTDLLNSMVHESEQTLLLLQDLLSASITGSLELRPVLQDPVKILRHAFDAFVLMARKKGIELVWRVPASLPPAELDSQRMAEVLSNLLSNSVKFCSRGQAVYLGARAADGQLEISVCDTGPGIRPEELPCLFEPFAQHRGKPTGGEPSNGLGLSIVKQIVELHGGQVSVESNFGHGTAFTLQLPLHYTQPAAN